MIKHIRRIRESEADYSLGLMSAAQLALSLKEFRHIIMIIEHIESSIKESEDDYHIGWMPTCWQNDFT